MRTTASPAICSAHTIAALSARGTVQICTLCRYAKEALSANSSIKVAVGSKMNQRDSSASSSEGWETASDGESNTTKRRRDVEHHDRNARRRTSQQNTATFLGQHNQGWQVGQNVRGNIAHTINVYETREPSQTFDREAEYLQHLSSGYRQQKNANPPRTPGTCQWFLEDERFQQWRDIDGSQLLHVFAAPGCGKSVLARALIDETLLTNERNTVVLYYFFKSGQGDQDRAFQAVSALLHQLYCKVSDPTLKAPAWPRYHAHGIKLCTMFDELWDIFLETTAKLDRNVVCVLDALDECSEEDRNLLISEIASFYSRLKPLSNLKLLVLSRPYRVVDFYPRLRGNRASFIRFNGDDKSEIVAREINMVIEDQVPVILHELTRSAQKEIIQYLQSMGNRTYLWLYLSLEYVQSKIAFHSTSEGMKTLLKELPPKVDEAYGKMLDSSPYPDLTRYLLSIVLAAKRPLEIQECSMALKVAQVLVHNKEDVWFDDFEVETDEQFQRSVNDLCGLLLSVRDSRIYFIHETAREYLLSDDGIIKTSSWKHNFNLEEANALLTKVCIEYLAFRDREAGSYEQQKHFGEYVIPHWISNYESGGEELILALREPFNRILKQQFSAAGRWTQEIDSLPLHYMCESGLDDIAEMLLELGADPNDKDYRGNTALHLALKLRRWKLISLCFEYNIDLSIRNIHGFTVFNDHIGLHPNKRVQMLIFSWMETKDKKPLSEDYFRNTVGVAVLSRNDATLMSVLNYPFGFEATLEDIALALRIMKDAEYADGIRMMVTNERLVSLVLCTPAYEILSTTAAECGMETLLCRTEEELRRKTSMELD